MTTITKYTSLADCLTAFQTTFNENPRVKKLIKNWTRSIVVEALDTEAVMTMFVDDLKLTQVLEGAHGDGDEQVHLQANQDVLIDIFSGERNPVHTLVDGELAVFSSEKDKVKLEAITMVIWGLT